MRPSPGPRSPAAPALLLLAALLAGLPGCRPLPPRAAPADPDPAGDTAAGRAVFVAPEDYLAAQVGACAGVEACGPCHPEESRHWSGTRHASARESLRLSGSEDDPACLRCHATLLLPSGADPSLLPLDRRSVGCEACHGPGRAHAAAPDRPGGAVTGVRPGCPDCEFRGICQGCHGRSCDPEFDFHRAYREMTHGSGRTAVPDPPGDAGALPADGGAGGGERVPG